MTGPTKDILRQLRRLLCYHNDSGITEYRNTPAIQQFCRTEWPSSGNTEGDDKGVQRAKETDTTPALPLHDTIDEIVDAVATCSSCDLCETRVRQTDRCWQLACGRCAI